jgi:hypothetical protein
MQKCAELLQRPNFSGWNDLITHGHFTAPERHQILSEINFIFHFPVLRERAQRFCWSLFFTATKGILPMDKFRH